MNDKLQVPSEIAAAVQRKRAEMAAEQAKKGIATLRQRNELIEKGRLMLRQKIEGAMQDVPAILHPYDVTEALTTEEVLKNIGEGYNSLSDLKMRFETPGLAPMLYRTAEKQWVTAYADFNQWDERQPDYSFKHSRWNNDFEYALVMAEEEGKKFVEAQTRYEEFKEQRLRLASENAERFSLNQAEKDEAAEESKSEELALFERFKDDGAAIALLKAFLMVQQERARFIGQINATEEAMALQEGFWSRKAKALRDQADEAERRAEEERSRASDLEDDVAKAKKKLRELER